MELRYDEDLVEEVVFLHAHKDGRGPPALQIARFHRERERLYAILDPDQRNNAFFKLHMAWFQEWNLEAPLLSHLSEFTLLSRELNTCAFRKARNKKEEGAELYVNGQFASPTRPLAPASAGSLPSQTDPAWTDPNNGTGKSGAPENIPTRPCRTAVMALQPKRWLNPEELARLLRHELTHLQDMLDPAFGYTPELPGHVKTDVQIRLATERYRVLWDITIDGRLAQAGCLPAAPPELHQTALARSCPFWPAAKQKELFDSLWQNNRPHHLNLLTLAIDPRGALQSGEPQPGAPCPLCGFATFDWVQAAGLPADLSRSILKEFPAWTPEQGLCIRCREAYEVLLKQPAQP